jgi:carboxypeptidase C (cathepsin A)
MTPSSWMSRITASLALAGILLGPGSADGAPLEDLIESLPDYGAPPTPHFSGYLDGTAGCDTESNGDFCKIHYWLALAEDDPLDKPVVLWLNGGPGSSSILGFLQENGPLIMRADGGLMENPWGWTKLANVMVVEAPVGVGFSYCANQLDGEVCENTDKFTASTSRAALQDFFGNKFPELASNEFFITGES